MYLTNTRPDICFAVNTLSQFMVEPRRVHWIATKHVLRYLKGTIEYGLRYKVDHEINLQGYTDADWVGSISDRKNTSGCCFNLGSTVISWLSRKQSSVTLSTPEAEYMAACLASGKAVWLRKMISGLLDQVIDVTCSWCDNQICIKMTENPVFHDRSKHISIKYHYIRDMVEKGVVNLQYVATEEQTADIFTKSLARTKFEHFRGKLGAVP